VAALLRGLQAVSQRVAFFSIWVIVLVAAVPVLVLVLVMIFGGVR
jgi:hypothetical protein